MLLKYTCKNSKYMGRETMLFHALKHSPVISRLIHKTKVIPIKVIRNKFSRILASLF